MLIWLIFAVLTAVVLVVVLAPFYVDRADARSRNAFDREVYRDQLVEVEADVARGLIEETEAQSARIEISRRLIASKDPSAGEGREDAGDIGSSIARYEKGSLRKAAFWSTALLVPGLAMAGYLMLGRSDMPGLPHAARFEKPLEQQNFSILIARVEERLRQRPGDGRGWTVIAPVYMRQGRFDDAVNAYERAMRLTGETGILLTGFAEALISANRGIIPEAARVAYEKVIALDRSDLRARFRLAMAQEQDGKLGEAAKKYRELMLLGDPDTPWRKLVGVRLASVNAQMLGGRLKDNGQGGRGVVVARSGKTNGQSRGPTSADIRAAQSMSAGDRAAMINSMVARLGSRLKENGDDIEGWLRLINANVVLGKSDAAKLALVLGLSSCLALLAAFLINLVEIGPGYLKAAKFKTRYVLKAFTNRPLRLANIGYFGHMWELYAMWSWLGLFLAASFEASTGTGGSAFAAKLATFAAIGAGAIGCLVAGRLADVFGRTLVTSFAMIVSGTLSVLVGFFFGANPYLVTVICIIWGIAAVADSAQFSASIMELSDPELIGTMVTVQTSIGFLITIITIQLTPYVVDLVGWNYGFAYLALGPIVGVIAMLKLRALPEAEKLAGGLR